YLLLMIYAFNIHIAHRMELTPSEKIEVAKRIEEAMDGRQGSNQHKQKVGVQNFVQAESGTKTIEIAAKAVDMNRETYRQAVSSITARGNAVILGLGTLGTIGFLYVPVLKPVLSRLWDIRDNRYIYILV
ncbi:MAG: hypothetical protein PHD40_07515, partial [Syntrophomonadaceae bacterium]|nr:hypothetical protein [Syntrophomonadaceae bacterium]